jgi:hypothetical protein
VNLRLVSVLLEERRRVLSLDQSCKQAQSCKSHFRQQHTISITTCSQSIPRNSAYDMVPILFIKIGAVEAAGVAYMSNKGVLGIR